MINPPHPRPVIRAFLQDLLARSIKGDTDPYVRARRRLMLCLGLSLLAHIALLLAPIVRNIRTEGGPGRTMQAPISVRLAHAAPPSQIAAEPTPAPPPPAPRHKSVIALSKPTPQSTPAAPPPPAPAPDAAEPMDMMAMLNAKRAQRRAQEESAARENAEAGGEPSADERALANIRQNLQKHSNKRDGTSGVFEILSKGTRIGRFSFRGWTADASSKWSETIEVDAGLHGNVELAIVRRMIELIRTHYTGDFNWESHKLGRVVVLSARLSDNAGLEAFLMREFFED